MSNNYIKPEQWLEAGYRKYTGYNPRSADYFFQKKFKDDIGVKYFIECYVYDYDIQYLEILVISLKCTHW